MDVSPSVDFCVLGITHRNGYMGIIESIYLQVMGNTELTTSSSQQICFRFLIMLPHPPEDDGCARYLSTR